MTSVDFLGYKKMVLSQKTNAVNNFYQPRTQLKLALIQRPTVTIYDLNTETEVHTNACKIGIGAMLLQRSDSGPFRTVAYLFYR